MDRFTVSMPENVSAKPAGIKRENFNSFAQAIIAEFSHHANKRNLNRNRIGSRYPFTQLLLPAKHERMQVISCIAYGNVFGINHIVGLPHMVVVDGID